MTQAGILEKAPILEDDRYRLCISLARLSRGNERYGSILINDDLITGFGFNRAISHPAFRLKRTIRQGYANHAEGEATDSMLANTKRGASGGKMFVAGYFPDSGQLFFQGRYSCIRCPPIMKSHAIESVSIPLPTGWVRKGVDEALQEAREFTKGTHGKRLDAVVGNFSIDQIAGQLLSLEQLKMLLRPGGASINKITLPTQS